MDDGEIWKDISGYEGLYQVSNYGRIKTVEHLVYNPHVLGNGCYRKCPEMIRSPNIMKGYHCIALTNNGKVKVFRIHRLVAEAFIGPTPSPEHQINHIDGDKSNNHVDNLEWVTPKENTWHAIRNGLMKPCSEERKETLRKRLEEKWQDEAYRKAQSEMSRKSWNEKRPERVEAITNGIHNSKSKYYLRNREVKEIE